MEKGEKAEDVYPYLDDTDEKKHIGETEEEIDRLHTEDV